MDKKSLIRVLVAALTALNTVLTALGYPIIPDDLTNAIVIVAGYVFELYTFFKNNYLTKRGEAQKKHLERVGLK